MKRYLGKRIFTIIPVLFIISIILFSLVKMMPGDPVAFMMDPNTRADRYEEIYEIRSKELGLDQNLAVQYVCYMKELMKGNLGYSSTYQAPVRDVILRPLSNTLILNLTSFLCSLVLTIGIGAYCALHKNSIIDHLIQFICTIHISMPSFFIAMFLIYVFAMSFHILPIGGMPRGSSIMEWIRYGCLPVLTMTLLSAAANIRYVRSEMIEVLSSDYIKAAKARGLSKNRILYLHALRNAVLPVAAVFMSELGSLMVGSIFIELMFSWDGIGLVLMKALTVRDAYLVISMNLLYAGSYIISNLLADLAYAWMDPRIQLQ